MKQIHLTKGRVALVDDADFGWVSKLSWCAMSAGAQTRIGKRRVLMHRLIMNAPTGTVVDHINHDRFDNRRSNLRVVSQKENTWNRLPHKNQQYKGVYPRTRKSGTVYLATVSREGRYYRLGLFANPEEAAKAYDAKARELFGDLAYLNFPNEVEQQRIRQITRRGMGEREPPFRWRRHVHKHLPEEVVKNFSLE